MWMSLYLFAGQPTKDFVLRYIFSMTFILSCILHMTIQQICQNCEYLEYSKHKLSDLHMITCKL